MSTDAVHLTIILALLLCLGLVVLFSASAVVADQNPNYDDPTYFLKRQALWAALGIGAFLATSRIPFEFWSKARRPLFAVTIGLLALLLIPGIGIPINGARR